MLSSKACKQFFKRPNLFSLNERSFSSLPKFATCDPFTLSGSKPYTMQNRVGGKWKNSKNYTELVDPLNGEYFVKVPKTDTKEEIEEVIASARKSSKSGLHNPLKNVERYTQYGDICFKAAALMREPHINDFLVKLVQRVMPKSKIQAQGEVAVTRKFIENFCSDSVIKNPRIMDLFNHSIIKVLQVTTQDKLPSVIDGLMAQSGVITPFNFPIEIPVLQMMGALFAGNKVLLKTDTRVGLVMEQFVRLLEEAGMPSEDLDIINAEGSTTENILVNGPFRLTQFTGSSNVAEHLSEKLKGKVCIEDAGFDWKILGPDVSDFDYVAWQSDQDAYAASGQKCSAQSILYVHKNWIDAGLIPKLKELAARRKLDDLTLGPVLTWNNQQIKEHIEKVLKIPGAKIEFGGQELTDHKIPKLYGAFQPTAISVPLKEMLKPDHFKTATKEVFGPFQIITTWEDSDLDGVLETLERMDHHLTAAVVTKDEQLRQKILAHTVNGTTYAGIRARTTGAPQNHWFGPAGDPRGGGIGTPEAILRVWTCHREIINDIGPVPKNWKIPPST